MCGLFNINKIEEQDYPFIGIISSNHQGMELKSIRKHISDFLRNGGGIIRICSKSDAIQSLNYLGRIWEIDLNHLYDIDRIIFIYREDYVVDDNIDSEGFLQAIEEGLDKLKKSGSKENKIYITIDSFWHSFLESDVQYYYDKLKNIFEGRKAGFIFRYIMEELDGEYIYGLLNNHDYLLVDMDNDFEVYTPVQLVHKSLNALLRHELINRRREKEIIRVEYLKTLGELMEGTVHDINNLLVTILGYAELLLSMNDCTDVENYLEIIRSTALEGKNIVDRIRNHIRGSYDSVKDTCLFNNIINSCIEMTKHKFKSPSNINRENMKLIVDLNSNSCIYGNEYEIRQAIINIILNGIDAIGDSGVLTIKTYDVENQAVLEIIDTGKGMDEFIKRRVFDPYFTTKGNKGTGLGLNIAKKVFDNHMAKVYIDSKIGKGTKFTICFPIKEKMYNIADSASNSYNIS